MALNPYYFWSIERILVRIDELAEARSRTHDEVDSEGVNGRGASIQSIDSTLELLGAALTYLDPVEYPASTTTRLTRTKAVLSSCNPFCQTEAE